MKDQEQNKNAGMDVPGTTDQGATTSEDVTKADFQAMVKEISLVTETGEPQECGVNRVGNFLIHTVAGHKSNDTKVLNGTTIVAKRIVKKEGDYYLPAPYTVEERKALLAIGFFFNRKKPMLERYIKNLPQFLPAKQKSGIGYFFPTDANRISSNETETDESKRTIAELMKKRFFGRHPNSHQREKFVKAILSAEDKKIMLTTIDAKGEKEQPVIPALHCAPKLKAPIDIANKDEKVKIDPRNVVGFYIFYSDAYMLGLDGSGVGYANMPENTFYLWDKYGGNDPLFAALYTHFITQHALSKKNIEFTYGELLESIFVDINATFYTDVGTPSQRPRWKKIESHLIECLNSFKRIHLVDYYKLDEEEPASRTKQCVAVLNNEWHDIQDEAVSKGLLEAKEHVKKKVTLSEQKSDTFSTKRNKKLR